MSGLCEHEFVMDDKSDEAMVESANGMAIVRVRCKKCGNRDQHHQMRPGARPIVMLTLEDGEELTISPDAVVLRAAPRNPPSEAGSFE